MPKPVSLALRLGGWCPVLDSQGRPEPWLSQWFSFELKREDWEWEQTKSPISVKREVSVSPKSKKVKRRLKVGCGDGDDDALLEEAIAEAKILLDVS